ncbi:MAG TPA: hypothetical protein VI389_05400, partial [Geobacteraceae bacterium]
MVPGVRAPFTASLLVLGASGIAAQTVLLRELLILFAGNELSLGVIIGAWVAAEALGAFTAGKWGRLLPGKASLFSTLTLASTLLFPAAILLCRLFKPLAGLPPDMGAGMSIVVAASLAVLVPVGFCHGFLFILACALEGEQHGTGATAAGKIYFIETLGTIMGGLGVGYLLIPLFTSFQIAFVILLVNAFACLFLRFAFPGPGKPGLVLPLLFLLVGIAVTAAGGTERLQRFAVARQWPGRDVVAYRNSFYQNITVVRAEGQYTFFTDGTPLITTPVPDIATVEEFVHVPLLAHPAPASVLVLGGGAGGVIGELLKYATVKHIDYVEIDPLLLKTIRDFPTPLTTAELGDPRVACHFGDARLFLRQTPRRYDVVLLNLPLPEALQGNRFFTREFFGEVRDVLAPGGIFALSAEGSLTYYGRELAAANASVLATLDTVFPHRFVMPGDINLFLVSATANLEGTTPQLLAARLKERRIETRLVGLDHLTIRLDPGQDAWFRETVHEKSGDVNRDFSPRLLFHSMAHHNQVFSPRLAMLLSRAGTIGPAPLALFIAALVTALLLVSRRCPGIAVPFAIATTGLGAMLFELFLFFGFQVFYGYVFYEAGLLITAFMGGAAVGSVAVTARLARLRSPRKVLLL